MKTLSLLAALCISVSLTNLHAEESRGRLAPADNPTVIPWKETQQLGVLYLGDSETLDELRTSEQYQFYQAYYPALADIQRYAVQSAGTDTFLIIPHDPQATLSIYDANGHTYRPGDKKDPASGKARYQGQGEPILLRTGAKMDKPDFTLILTSKDGKRLIYQPYYSHEMQDYMLLDDSIADAIFNLTLYPRLSLDTQAVLPGITASVRDGEVILDFSNPDYDQLLLSGLEAQNNKIYTVQGLSAPAQGVRWSLREGDVLLLILTTQNTLETLHLNSSLLTSDFTTSGALLEDVQGMSSRGSVDGDALYAVNSQGDMRDIPTCLFNEGLWEYSADSGERHVLTLFNWNIRYQIYNAAGELQSDQRGRYRMTSDDYATGDNDGYLADYRYTFTDGSSGILRINHFYGENGFTLSVQALEGNASFAGTSEQPALYQIKYLSPGAG